jgi:predicted MFS family arabinose efflux permease
MKPTNYQTIWFATLLFFGAFYTLLAPLPRYLAAVGLSDWQIGIVLGAFGIAALIGRPLAGIAADRWGPRPVLLFGAGALLLGAVAVPLTSQLWLLVALRVCQTIGYVAFTTAGTALVIQLTPPDLRGQRLALFGAAANVAITLTPALTTAALSNAPSTSAFFVAGGLACVAGMLVLGLGGAAPTRHTAALTPALLRPLVLPMLAAALTGAGFAAFFQFIPLFSERRGGMSIGLLYTLYGVGIITARIVTGPLLDRWSLQRSLSVATALMTAGLALLALPIDPLLAAPAALLIAFGSGLSHPALLKHHAALLPTAPGQASAAFYVGFDLGIGLGSLLFGFMLQLGGLSALYASAALLTLCLAPLVPLLLRER